MVLIGETPFPLELGSCCTLSCLLVHGGGLLGLDLTGDKLCSWGPDGTLTQTALPQKYEKLCYSQARQCFFALSPWAPGSVFLLDPNFRELDRIGVRPPRSDACAQDIWFDPESDLLFLLFPEGVYRFNLNGDCLGAFMTAPQGTQYRALCTCGALLLLAYERDGCCYVSSYTPQGGHLERVSLGGAYTVCNLQPIQASGESLLRVFAHKKPCFPYTLELELTARRTAALTVECFSEAPRLHPTCHIHSPFGR